MALQCFIDIKVCFEKFSSWEYSTCQVLANEAIVLQCFFDVKVYFSSSHNLRNFRTRCYNTLLTNFHSLHYLSSGCLQEVKIKAK